MTAVRYVGLLLLLLNDANCGPGRRRRRRRRRKRRKRRQRRRRSVYVHHLLEILGMLSVVQKLPRIFLPNFVWDSFSDLNEQA